MGVADTGIKAAVGTAAGVASSFSGGAVPHASHQMVANVAAQGGRVATDAFRHSIRHGSSILTAAGAGAAAVGSAAMGGASAATAAAAAAAVAAAPIVLGAAVVGGIGYALYKIFED